MKYTRFRSLRDPSGGHGLKTPLVTVICSSLLTRRTLETSDVRFVDRCSVRLPMGVVLFTISPHPTANSCVFPNALGNHILEGTCNKNAGLGFGANCTLLCDEGYEPDGMSRTSVLHAERSYCFWNRLSQGSALDLCLGHLVNQ